MVKLFNSSVFTVFLILLIASFSAVSCGSDEDENVGEDKVGTLQFIANGEDFARNGFVSEDGWSINFTHVYASIYGPTAYQVGETSTPAPVLMHAGHPHADIPEGSAHVALLGYFVVDLAQGDAPAVLGESEAKIGNYNRVNFELKPLADATDSDSVNYVQCKASDVENFKSYPLVFVGTATKGDQSIDFTIKVSTHIIFSNCGPNGTVGVVAEGETGTAEMTFHFDHIFGDASAGAPDTTDPTSVNYLAVGFDYFARFANDGTLDISDAEIGDNLSGTEFMQFMDVLYSIGHSGEAHCSHQ